MRKQYYFLTFQLNQITYGQLYLEVYMLMELFDTSKQSPIVIEQFITKNILKLQAKALLSLLQLIRYYNSVINQSQSYHIMADQKQQKSNIKNSNPKIGRPAKTDQEEQFKNYYLDNRKKFQLECELLVYIHHIFFEEIPTHPINNRVEVTEMVKLFQNYDCMPIYRILSHLNELYFKSSSLFPQEKMRYTSLIDISYMMRQIKIEHGDRVSSYELILLVFFFLYNERVVNSAFCDYFKKRIEIFRNGMINGPDHCELNKMDTLIIALGLQTAIREDMIIEEDVEMDCDEEGEIMNDQDELIMKEELIQKMVSE